VVPSSGIGLAVDGISEERQPVPVLDARED
jgi:hypothetical protein